VSALITFGRNRMAYTAMRSLARRGIDAVVGDSYSPSMCFYSRHCSGHFVYPSPYRHPKGFIDSLIGQAGKRGCRVLIPMHEEGYVIARFRDRLEPHMKVPLASEDQIMALHDKGRFAHLAGQLDLPVPRTHLIDRMEEVERIAGQISYPAVVKPRRAHGAFGLRYVRNGTQLREAFAELVERYQYAGHELPIVQEYVRGVKHSVCMLFNHGRLRALCTFRFLREYPVEGGTAVLRISTRQERMEQIARQTLEHLRWHGIAEAEFVLTAGGEPLLLEINPRFWGSLYQGVASGVDFPYLLYRMAVDGDVEPVLDYPTGVKTRWLWGDWRALCDYLRHPLRHYRTLVDYARCDRRDVTYDDFYWDDPVPFVVEMIYPLVSFFTKGTFNPVEKGSEYDREG
jgi:predicted ATP-grasp superfamily ATP-dependent carboligase